MDFSITVPDKDDGGRGAFRTRVPGLELRVSGRPEYYEVADLSASGFAFEGLGFKEGTDVSVDFFLKKKVFLTGLSARIVRIITAKNLVACTFQELDRRQEALLDKLVLEVQKRMIAARKAKQKKEQERDRD